MLARLKTLGTGLLILTGVLAACLTVTLMVAGLVVITYRHPAYAIPIYVITLAYVIGWLKEGVTGE